jgi:hypothetical protein
MSLRFTVTIDCGNAAFDPDPGPEVARILHQIAERVASICGEDYTDRKGGWFKHYQTIHDSNGNDVGRFAFKDAR